jgi:glycosyltransferase involved in cell wall biosynthesis
MVKLTVIITAHDRKKFLLDAVNSAINQTISRKHYEILVVKNFKDDYIDNKLEDLGIINIITETKSLGGKIVLGVHEARGEIISILEDDDLFLPNKIEKVIKVFSNNNYNISYYHNSYVHINEEGKILSCPIKLNHPLLLNIREEKIRYIRKLFSDYYTIYNNSSISIERSVIMRNKEYIKKLTYALDIFLYYSSILSNKGAFFDTEILTKQRIHKFNTKVRDENFYKWLSKMKERLENSIEEFTLIQKFLIENKIDDKIIRLIIADRKVCLARLPNGYARRNLNIKDLFYYVIFHKRNIKDILQLFLIIAPNTFRLKSSKKWYEVEA